jgi:hypothetical protein
MFKSKAWYFVGLAVTAFLLYLGYIWNDTFLMAIGTLNLAMDIKLAVDWILK